MTISTPLSPFALLLLAGLSLSGCKKENAATETADVSAGLVGRWQLTDRQCFCLRTPVPNEAVVFTAATFSFYKDGQRTAGGTYAQAPVAPMCGGNGTVPGLRLTITEGSFFYKTATFTVSGNKLVLDYGRPCDAPFDTYQRLP